ncbi:sulfide/dihydroorotate dehydrogenase-like FAD/NAD-binding protein [Candidatus Oleimmundimicrobium sp.]|uniref:sulfide/dihydroorotate dehydrogenase-like FAD/NAD-binding protein n=1 Tax=Candidatus Oleimmundimicrobium sp. TaxID=3060597 RepID=UPI00271BB5C4|nr:sulfide/dihydroorotate dehydrogenase-like FAD/NAD-binding protein [Candidatus Oleimmundimicrobium sp.]MDO8886461.1 sulfide/dihydroorotate dehydrogenase-like FAD/NAD-binding protein [Candidatus Oleimmundimicrobium sp.]
MFKILDKKKLAPSTFCFEIEAPGIARKAKEGQFVILRIDELGERIPLTLFDFNEEKGAISLIFQELGKTTRQLALLSKGDFLADVVGPLGKPSEIENFGTIVCVAGGVGAAVILPVARALKKAGNRVTTILGSRNKELLILEDEIRLVSDKFFITTDDGSKGRHGVVTDVLKELIEGGQEINRVVAIGPVIMMKFVCKTTEPHKIKTVVSLNSIMVDGTGMCGSCRVTVGGETKFCCVDGPEFDGHLVDFDELMNRQKIYLEEEKVSLKEYETKGLKKVKCRCKAEREK